MPERWTKQAVSPLPAGLPVPELLAPAGSPQALVAAVRAGATAVYLGLPQLNARYGATNFSAAEAAEAVAYCHARGVKVHLTLNTLVREEELDTARRAVETACALGVDALIVQDLGVARLVRAMAPDMPLHASTQLSCHTPGGVRLLKEAGFSRVVLSREMSLSEIRACAAEGCELETFVHGALCMSVSGQCYFSAMLGGRSGNRGRCAQPCRLPFRLSDGTAAPAEKAYALSLKDAALLNWIPRLVEAGVCSLKIEGRMKRPEYVAAATACYAALLRGEHPGEELLNDLQSVFSRSGFTDGYVSGERGGMFGYRRAEDVAAAAEALPRLKRLYEKESPRVPVSAAVELAAGHPATLTLTDGVHRVCVTGGEVPAERPPLPPERVDSQLKKSGGTPFSVESVTQIGGGGVAVSELNRLRRDALEQLEQRRGELHAVPCSQNIPPSAARVPSALWRGETGPHRLVRLASAAQWSPRLAETVDGWFFPLAAATTRPAWGVEIPRGLFGQEETVRRQLAAAAAHGVRYALCGHVGAVALAREAGLQPVGDFGLNLANPMALHQAADMGLKAATLSMELAFRQMGFAKNSPLPCGALLYGRQPLMLVRNCPRRENGGCADCTPQNGVTDRRGVTFPTACNGAATELLNSVPLYWADRLDEVPPLDFWLLRFTDETAEQAVAVATAYQNGAPAAGEITRGLYRRGVE